MTIEEKRRELFEEFLAKVINQRVVGPYRDDASNAAWVGFNAALDVAEAERDQLRAKVKALRKVANELRGSAECHNVHHCKAEQHEIGEPCKVLARIDAAMSKGEVDG